jgi:hypothetical protein
MLRLNPKSLLTTHERKVTMKNPGPLLAGGLTLLIVLTVGIFSFLPLESAAPETAASTGPIVVPAVDTSQLEATMAQREAVYQNQLQQLNQTLEERQNTYQNQIQTLNSEITTTKNQLVELQTQQQDLSAQISQLENTRAERLATYQTQLEQLNQQYKSQLAQLQAQLNEAQTKLAEVNAQLGQ